MCSVRSLCMRWLILDLDFEIAILDDFFRFGELAPECKCGSRSDFFCLFVKNSFYPGSIVIGTKRFLHLSRLDCPG